jgi:aminopeptidase-like protein
MVEFGSNSYQSAGEAMVSWAKEMFPFPRSLTGKGVRETLHYLRTINPEMRVVSYPSGARVFDWEVPLEWLVDEAFIEHVPSGRRFANFSDSNLHLVGYSEPVDDVMSREDVKGRIFTQPEQPNWIPYVTSYYRRTWGFCMSENEKNALPSGDYRVVISSKLFDGEMLLADAVLPGQQSQEIFFSSYICHPSMANNELSGPVLISALLQFVTKRYPSPRYTYRFALVPETIGSLAYLQDNLDDLKREVVCGFNLSCVGDDRSYSHVESRLGSTMADSALEAAFIGLPNAKKYPFLARGSDERQYCAPGIDLPLAGFCRTRYGEYPEYHTSADNFDVVTEQGLQGSFNVMSAIIQAFEMGLYPKVAVLGEPQLGKRGLYPTTSQKGMHTDIRTRMDVLAYSDGKHSVFDIAKKIAQPLADVLSEIELLVHHGLLNTEPVPW